MVKIDFEYMNKNLLNLKNNKPAFIEFNDLYIFKKLMELENIKYEICGVIGNIVKIINKL